MRPATRNSTTMAVSPAGAAADLRNFSSPIPYLFGGLALVLAVIATALVILACSFRKQHSSSNSCGDEEKHPKMVDSEPKIVVIMAGESNPTYLAKPVSSTTTTHPQQAL